MAKKVFEGEEVGKDDDYEEEEGVVPAAEGEEAAVKAASWKRMKTCWK